MLLQFITLAPYLAMASCAILVLTIAGILLSQPGELPPAPGFGRANRRRLPSCSIPNSVHPTPVRRFYAGERRAFTARL